MNTFENINNEYIIVKNIGTGGFAEIYLSYDIINNKFVAMKVSNNESNSVYNDCVNEIITYKKCGLYKKDNEYIVNIINSFIYKKRCCYVMELLGKSIFDYRRNESKKLSYDNLIKIIFQLLKSIEYLHNQNIIHGDIKPENILLCDHNFDLPNLNNFAGLSIDDITNKLKKHFDFKDIKYDVSDNDFVSDSDENSDTDSDNESDCDKNYGEKHIPDFSDSDDLEDEEMNSESTIDENLNARVKLCDMGGGLKIDEEIKNKKKYTARRMGTEYYNSPEILLNNKYFYTNTFSNEDKLKYDIWALGCSIYEILTDEILFDVFDNDDVDEDDTIEYHLYLISCKIGKIQKPLISKSEDSSTYFNKDNKLINYNKINDDNIFTKIKKTYTDFKKVEDFISFLKGCLAIDPSQRFSVKQCLDHQIFLDYNKH